MVALNSTAEFYDEIYRANPSKWTNIDRDFFAFKMISANIERPDWVLDIGCGNGHTLALFHSQWPDADYTGMDISTVALEAAKKRIPDATWTNVWPVLPVWDLILIMGVAEHFPDPANQLRLIGLSLTPKGRIYLEVPNCLYYSEDKTEGFRKTHNGADQDEWHWKRETWEKAIGNAKLEIEKRFTGLSPAWQFIWFLRRK